MILKLSNISKKFDNRTVLKNVSLEILKGEVIALVGPSGSGKSTLLRAINFLEVADSGTVQFRNIQLSESNIRRFLPKIGMVFQHFNLFPNMTVLENLTLAPIKVLNKDKDDVCKIALELLRKVDLLDKQNSYPSSLSGGQKQRIAIARSLCMQPEILLLDEPTSALDPEMVSEVLEVIKSFVKSGITIIMATHEMNFARTVADKIIFLDKGEIIEEAKPEEFFNNPKSVRVKEFLEKVL